MTIKSATGWALAATCLTAIAAMPAVAQMAPYGSPDTAPPAYQGNANPNPPTGTYSAPSGNYTPQTDQGGSSPDWSQGNYGSTSGTTTEPSAAGTTTLAAPPPRVNRGDLYWDPQRNVMESQRYDRLVETNPMFRTARIRKECGPITDPQLKADCVASFDQYEPLVAPTTTTSPRRTVYSRHHPIHYGSSATPRHYQSSSGR